LALKTTTNKKDPRAYRITFASKNNGCGFSAKTFLDHIGVDYSERKSFPVDINPNSEYLIELKLPPTMFQQKAQPRLVAKEITK
jgi:hypothetical protein